MKKLVCKLQMGAFTQRVTIFEDSSKEKTIKEGIVNFVTFKDLPNYILSNKIDEVLLIGNEVYARNIEEQVKSKNFNFQASPIKFTYRWE